MPPNFEHLSPLGKTCYLYFHAKAPKSRMLKAILDSGSVIVRDVELEEPRLESDETFFARMISKPCRVVGTAQYMYGVVSDRQCGQYNPSVAGIFRQRVILADPESKGCCADCRFYDLAPQCSLRPGPSPDPDSSPTDHLNYPPMAGLEYENDVDRYTFHFSEDPDDVGRSSIASDIASTLNIPSFKQTPSSLGYPPADGIPTQTAAYAALVQNVLDAVRTRLTVIETTLTTMTSDNISITLLKQQVAFIKSNSATINDILQELQSSNEPNRDMKRWKDIVLMSNVALRTSEYMMTAAVEVNHRSWMNGWDLS